jgi:hypothetical protein
LLLYFRQAFTGFAGSALTAVLFPRVKVSIYSRAVCAALEEYRPKPSFSPVPCDKKDFGLSYIKL